MPSLSPRRAMSFTEVAVWVFAIVEAIAIAAALWLR
jgi:hypothetical protein